LDYVDRLARYAWATGDLHALDWMWYLWCGYHSPLAGRVMKTFERAYVLDKSTWAEPSDPYFELARNEDVALRVLAEFGLTDPDCVIVNGHTPVHEIDGDTPLRANGRLMVIDGGFCRAYHAKTGIAGYTLIADSNGIRLKAHRPFTSVADALASNYDIASAHETIIADCRDNPIRVSDTDDGLKIREQIEDLSELLQSYRSGTLAERGA
jgi:fructose-1,6-bisphosphatase-3